MSEKVELATGIITPVLTPRDESGNVDDEAARGHMRQLLDAGIHGLFTAGTAGEYFALTLADRRRITEIALEVSSGRVPVYMGVTGDDTRSSIEQAKLAQEINADAITVMAPSGSKFSPDELHEHFRSIAGALSIPMVIYDNPGRTGVKIPFKTIELLSRIENIVGIKDSTGDNSLTCEYVRVLDSSFSVMAGRDTLILQTLIMGGKGAVAATSNVAPRLVVEIYEAFLTGDYERARSAQFRLTPLRNAFQLGSSSAVMLKEAALMLGVDLGRPFEPCLPLSEKGKSELTNVIEALDKGVLIHA